MVHQTLQQKGTKSSNIILDENILNIFPTSTLYMNFINLGPIFKTNILQYTWLDIETIGAHIVFGQRLQSIDN